MRTKQIAVFMVLSVMALAALGATNSVTTTNSLPANLPNIRTEANGLLLALIPLLVPVIVAIAKTALKWLPTWALPILAAAMGELLNVVSGLAGGPTTTVLGGVILGSSGVGLREIIDQLNQKRKGDSEPPANT